MFVKGSTQGTKTQDESARQAVTLPSSTECGAAYLAVDHLFTCILTMLSLFTQDISRLEVLETRVIYMGEDHIHIYEHRRVLPETSRILVYLMSYLIDEIK